MSDSHMKRQAARALQAALEQELHTGIKYTQALRVLEAWGYQAFKQGQGEQVSEASPPRPQKSEESLLLGITPEGREVRVTVQENFTPLLVVGGRMGSGRTQLLKRLALEAKVSGRSVVVVGLREEWGELEGKSLRLHEGSALEEACQEFLLLPAGSVLLLDDVPLKGAPSLSQVLALARSRQKLVVAASHELVQGRGARGSGELLSPYRPEALTLFRRRGEAPVAFYRGEAFTPLSASPALKSSE